MLNWRTLFEMKTAQLIMVLPMFTEYRTVFQLGYAWTVMHYTNTKLAFHRCCLGSKHEVGM